MLSAAAATLSRKAKDSKFFTTTKKGEIHELKEELNNPKFEVCLCLLFFYNIIVIVVVVCLI